MDADRLLEGLDPEQRLAVTSPSLLLAVIAGAGSGKTSVLTRRIAHRIATDTIDPRHVAAITFTRQAAGELRRRLVRLGVRDQVTAGTFHATALTLLRQHWDDTRRPTPAITNDRRRILADVLGRDVRSDIVREVAAEIDWARARTIGPDTYARTATRHGRRPSVGPAAVAEAMVRYAEDKRRRGVVDLDDLLAMTLDLMRRDSAFAAAARWRFRHLFVDEAQDLNPLQMALLDHWRSGRDDLTLVGDPHQAIYGFNGADPSLLTSPEDRFPGIEIVELTTNYRCTPEIVSAGLAVLAETGQEPALRSARDHGRPVEALGFVDESAEAAGVARLVREHRPPGGSWRGLAVLARTNAQLLPIAEALRAATIPCRLSGAARAATPLQRALREAAEQRSAHLLATWAIDVSQTPVDPGSSVSADPIDVDPGGGDAVTRVPDDDADADVRALRRVASAVEEFLAIGGGDGAAFMSWVRATDPFRDEDDAADAVELLTFHAAKGREWSHVVVAGVCTGLVPHVSAVTESEKAEEWRLLYVALTRASETVTITHPEHRSGRAVRPNPLVSTLHSLVPEVCPPPRRERMPTSSSSEHDQLVAALVDWRARTARAAGVPPAVVLDDAALAAVARVHPASVEELAEVPGIGQLMARRFGRRILEVMRDADS